jgi:Fic family protein
MDTVKKILTVKSGQFVFSRKYEMDKLATPVAEATILHTTVKDLPILPDLADRMQKDLIRRSIFGTAAIEGNPLTETRVAEIVDNPENTGLKEKAEIEIKNLEEVYGYLRLIQSTSAWELTEAFINDVHRDITKGLDDKDNIPGAYRNHPVKVGDRAHGGVYTPPKYLIDIEPLMKELVSWINSEEVMKLSPFVRASLAHYHFALIHPFGNGNGRTARLIEAALLKASGIKYLPEMLSNFYYRNIDEYFLSFSTTRKHPQHDVTTFLEFTLRGVVEALNEIKNAIIYFIRVFTMRDYYAFLRARKDINQRQHALLTALLDDRREFSFGELLVQPRFSLLYKNVSERTARRDIKRLCEDKRLLVCEKDKYSLNLQVLG